DDTSAQVSTAQSMHSPESRATLVLVFDKFNSAMRRRLSTTLREVTERPAAAARTTAAGAVYRGIAGRCVSRRRRRLSLEPGLEAPLIGSTARATLCAWMPAVAVES